MKKEEKTKKTYERILLAAINEFGTNGYDKASISTICNDYKIPKGLLYHNFKSKDELYLKCVEDCLNKMNIAAKNTEYTSCDVEENIKRFLSNRQTFFKENINYANIFFSAVLKPPTHLRKEIQKIKNEFDIYSRKCYKKILANVSFREGITIDLAVEYFTNFQEMFNIYFQSKIFERDKFDAVIKEHELSLTKFLKIILYGIVQNEK